MKHLQNTIKTQNKGTLYTHIISEKKNQSGRSMVEMLGVLAVIGVLSVAGIAGYTTSINKHRANELLNEASKRAAIVSGQIVSENSPSLNDFTNRDYGYAVFDDKVYGEDGMSVWDATKDKKFSLQIKWVSKVICENMQNSVGGIVQGFDPFECEDDATVILTYNNDLSTTKTPSTENPTLQRCSGKNSQCCDSSTGDTISYDNEICDFNGEDKGICLDGQCVKNNTDKSCNVNNYSGNTDCGGVGSGFYCYYSTAKCRAITAEQRASGKLQTDFSNPGRGTDWYTAMNFCASLGKKLPSLSSLAIALPSKKQQCYLPDYPESTPLVPDACVTTTTLASLQARFNETTHALYVSNSDGSYSYIVDLGGTHPGYVYRNHKTSAQGLAICVE